MTLPLFQFRNRLGEPVNLSTAEAREEITKAELYQIVDVGEGLWCRPCQSTGCLHTLQIEQVLATAGLGTPRTGTYHELPGIARFTRYCAVGEMVVECWFDNGARVRFHERRDGAVVQSVFAREDSRDPAEMTEKPTRTARQPVWSRRWRPTASIDRSVISMACARAIPSWHGSLERATLDTPPAADREL